MQIIKYNTLLLCSLCLIFFCIASSADTHEKSQYILQKIAQAPQIAAKDSQWLQLLEQPGNSRHYYLASKQGQIYQLEQDSPQSTALLLDLPHILANQSVLHLSALTLHPNFSKRDQAGYATFYTAHAEKAPEHTNTKYLHESNISMAFRFNTVVTEWQLTSEKKINPLKKREVLRIAISAAKNGIKQLSFNPYSKSWHEDFSQLYISLAESPKLKHYPLYSGTILRIHPQRDKLDSYTVSHSNPFYANNEINQSIFLLGAGNIQQFIWPNKHSTRLLISHQYGSSTTKKQLLSYSDGGDDWRVNAPKEFIYQNTKILSDNSLLVYRGQNAPTLRNKLLLLTQNKRQWQLNSLPEVQEIDDMSTTQTNLKEQENLVPSTKVEWQLDPQALLAHQLSLFRDNRGELLFFNEDTGAIYQLFQQDKYSVQKNKQSTSGAMTFLFVIVVGALCSYIAYLINIGQSSAKYRLKRQFSKLSLSKDKLSIKLFKRYQNDAKTVISFTNIYQCQLLLGDVAIATINTTLGNGFNNQQEQELREIFHIEQINKMVDRKVRRITLVIKTNDKNNYNICLYLRKGSDRITKGSYLEVVDDAINWCWLIAENINSEQTGHRNLKQKLSIAKVTQAEHKAHDDTSRHTQADISRPEAKQTATVAPIEKIDESLSLYTSYPPVSDELNNTVAIDLVNEIEKLVKLHQQGFLSVDEFTQAKARLLASFNNTE